MLYFLLGKRKINFKHFIDRLWSRCGCETSSYYSIMNEVSTQPCFSYYKAVCLATFSLPFWFPNRKYFPNYGTKFSCDVSMKTLDGLDVVQVVRAHLFSTPNRTTLCRF